MIVITTKIVILSAFLALIGSLVYLINHNKLSLKSGFVWIVGYLSLSATSISNSLPVTMLLIYTIVLFGYMAYKIAEAKV